MTKPEALDIVLVCAAQKLGEAERQEDDLASWGVSFSTREDQNERLKVAIKIVSKLSSSLEEVVDEP